MEEDYHIEVIIDMSYSYEISKKNMKTINIVDIWGIL